MTPRLPWWRLLLAGICYTIADLALRAAVRIDRTLTADEVRAALEGDR
jgi:hypothetical protein